MMTLMQKLPRSLEETIIDKHTLRVGNSNSTRFSQNPHSINTKTEDKYLDGNTNEWLVVKTFHFSWIKK